MALKGTLKDFGVAEILQLIAQQTKSGVLRLNSRDEEVLVAFHEGNVVRAEHVTGKEAHLLGHRLVRAGLITERDLEDALEEQRRTLKRLGDVLVARGAVAREELREMAQLQATETLYRLFSWKTGTYEFEAVDVARELGTIEPIRCEAVLMEGFRMVDEWPLVRKRISSRRMTFERLADLPPQDGEDSGAIGANEHRVMALVQTGRTVERLIELSRLGEFETCKALLNLVNEGHLKAIPPKHEEGQAERLGAGMVRTIAEKAYGFALRVLLTAGLFGLLTGIVYLARADEAVGGSRGIAVEDPAAQRLVGRAQAARIAAALELFRLETGTYPNTLDELVEAELLEERDLTHPWRDRYHYRRTGDDRFVLLPPFE